MLKRPLVVATLILAIIAAIAIAIVVRQRGPLSGEGSSPSDIARGSEGRRPVIFLGLDGADWRLLDDYIRRGVMPALAALVADGASGTVKTIDPPLSPLVWTTMMTGVSPLEHGILDFVQFNRTTGQKEPITSSERRAPAIWNMATTAGRSSAVFGLWATYPAETIDGLVVSDRLFTFLFKEQAPPAGVVHPADRDAWARDGLARAERAIDYATLKQFLPWLGESEYQAVADSNDPYGHPVSALRRILVETTVYRDLSLDWVRQKRPDLTVVYFQGTDTIGHVFAPYAPPRQASVDAIEFDRYHDVPERFFRAFDETIARYRDAARDIGAVIMIASDHGFLWNEGRPTRLSSVATASAAKWHAPQGIYVVSGPGIDRSAGQAGTHHGNGSVEQVCATLLALLGLPPGRDVNGDPLPGVRQVTLPHADYAASYHPAAASTVAAPAAAGREALANLRALGYIGSAESGSAPAGSRGTTRTPGSYNNEGILLRGKDKLPEAMGVFEKALALDPNLVSAQWNLSDILYAKGQNLERSDDLLLRAFGGGLPEGEKYLVGRAIAYQRNGDAARSLTLMDRAVRAKPDVAELWLFRGRYRVDGDDCRGALQDFDRAVALAPSNAAAHSARGLAMLCLGNRAGARASFERSLAIDPAQPKVREYLSSTRQ